MKKTAPSFVLLFFVCSLSFGQSPRGKGATPVKPEDQPKGEVKDQYYVCDGFYLAGKGGPAAINGQYQHFLTPVFEAKATNAEVNRAWNDYLVSKYGGDPSGLCSIGDPAGLARLRARPKRYPIVQLDWKYKQQ